MVAVRDGSEVNESFEEARCAAPSPRVVVVIPLLAIDGRRSAASRAFDSSSSCRKISTSKRACCARSRQAFALASLPVG